MKGTNEVESRGVEAKKMLRSELVEIEVDTLQKSECEKDLRIRTDIFENKDIQFACPESWISDQNNAIETEMAKREEYEYFETESQTVMSVDEKGKIKIPHSEYFEEKKTKKEEEYSEYAPDSFSNEVVKTETEADTFEYYENITESLIKTTVKEEQGNNSFLKNMKYSGQKEANSTQEEGEISVLFESKGKGFTSSRKDFKLQKILEIPHKPDDKKEIIRRGKSDFVMKYKSITDAGEYEETETAKELRQMEILGLPTVLQLGKGRMANDHNPNVHLTREKTLFCEPCKLRLNSEDTMKSHLNGKKHMKKLLFLNTDAKVNPRK